MTEPTLPAEEVRPDRTQVIHGDALALPLPDESVDLVVTSPPYRSADYCRLAEWRIFQSGLGAKAESRTWDERRLGLL